MEHLDVGNREIQGREGRSDQVRVFPWAGGMAHCLSVAQVDEQADAAPSAADAHVRQVAAHVRARGAPLEAPRRDVGRIGFAGLAGMDLESLPAVGARQAVFPHDTAGPAPADRFARPSQRRLCLARAASTSGPMGSGAFGASARERMAQQVDLGTPRIPRCADTGRRPAFAAVTVAFVRRCAARRSAA